MMKRIVALALCLVCLLLTVTGCSHGENDKGAYIRMYLSEPVYDVDPLNAFDDQSTLQIVSLLYEGLFTADENGKPEKALVEDFEYVEDEEEGRYYLTLILKDTQWSDGVPISATDAQYAFRRLFAGTTKHPAAAMLYDIKNAAAIAAGDDSVDHLGVVVVDESTLEIEFAGPIDIDTFLPVLCSPALYPVRAEKVEADPKNWGKAGDAVVCSGPFIINSMNFTEKDGFVLERNGYYFRDRMKDDYDVSVKPYRIVVDYSKSAADQIANYNTGEEGNIYYFGYIPLSARGEKAIVKKANVSDAASTFVYYMNQSVAPFNNPSVRKALSMVLDRQAIADALVFAEAADGIVPNTVRNRADKSTDFRKKAESYLASTANAEGAKQLLQDAGVNAASYSFSITVNGSSEEQKKIAELTAAAWGSLGFKVTVKALDVYEIKALNDKGKEEGTGMYASAYREALQSGSFEVIGLDLVATAPTAFSYLAPFAAAFSGNGYTTDVSTGTPVYTLTPHITGYNSEAYNAKIDAAYAEKNERKRAALLHEAEALLMEEMPAIPVVYNQNATLGGKKLSGVESSFFCPNLMQNAKLSGYWKIALRDGFVKEEDEE